MIGGTQTMASVLIIDPRAATTNDTIGGIPGGMCETTIVTTGTTIADPSILTGMADIAPTAIAMATVSTAADTVTDIYRWAILTRTPAGSAFAFRSTRQHGRPASVRLTGRHHSPQSFLPGGFPVAR